MNTNKIRLPELLAPAGSMESAMAAVAGGADALYFGGEQFSARARAKNLTFEEISALMRECRGRGIKGYGAINTRLRDGELADAAECAYEMLCAGVDALIVADLGLAVRLREIFPRAELHASTQISGTSVADAEALAKLGFSRMVCPRELSFEELRELTAESPIGIEMFIHGAHCVSVSGQCSMSFVMGGRSGNRGDCAGPCRLPFDGGLGEGRRGVKPKGFALSLKDMCLASHVEEIISMGVESLKIEGRLKGPEYTYGVVKIYRDILDGRRNATPDEVARLSEYFSRDGFSDGYYRCRYGGMLGTKKDSEIRQDKERFPVPEAKRVPVKGRLYLRCGDVARLVLESPFGRGEAVGDVVDVATGNPPPRESLEKSISKLGQTPFVLESLEIDTDGVCGIAASALNALRRSAVDALCSPSPVVRAEMTAKAKNTHRPDGVEHTAILATVSQMTDAVTDYFDNIYIPFGDYVDGGNFPVKVGVSLPEMMYESLADAVCDAVAKAVSEGRRVLVHTVGQLDLAVNAGAVAVCSHRLVVYNGDSAAKLCEMGAESVTLSPEVSVSAARSLSAAAPTAVVTGGRMPLMLCRRCPMSDGGRNCKMGRAGGFDGQMKKNVCHGFLRDRTGAVLPSVGDRFCMTTVYNSVPTFTDMTDRDMAAMGVSETVHIFSSESPRECDETVEALRHGTPPKEYRKLR